MKTIPYATLPCTEDFSAAFDTVVTGYYTLYCNDADARMIEELGLDLYNTHYTKSDLYELCEALLADATSEEHDWADESWSGQFLCDILYTLGFEWV